MLGILTDSLRIPGEVAVVLRYYVYALRDPRNGRVFYIGKGIGDRINAHTRDAGKDPESERAKLRTILDIEATGHPVELLFLRTDIEDETTAFIVEQAVIDAFHADGQPLTNLVRGHDSGARGLAALPAIIARHRADPCPPINQPLIMVKIQKGWRPDSNPDQIYDQTRGHWRSQAGSETAPTTASESPSASSAAPTASTPACPPRSRLTRARTGGASPATAPPNSPTSSAPRSATSSADASCTADTSKATPAQNPTSPPTSTHSRGRRPQEKLSPRGRRSLTAWPD